MKKKREKEEKAAKLRNDKSRFIFSTETKKEFKLKQKDIPVFMRDTIKDNSGYVNHVDQNVRLAENYKKIHAVEFLYKIKQNQDTLIANNQKKVDMLKNHRDVYVKKLNKWDDFRVRRQQVIDNYIAAKRV